LSGETKNEGCAGGKRKKSRGRGKRRARGSVGKTSGDVDLWMSNKSLKTKRILESLSQIPGPRKLWLGWGGTWV